MKIHAVPCATGRDAWTHQCDLLREFYESSVPQLHEWTESPDEADVIFLTNSLQSSGVILEGHSYPRRYPEKCFLLSEQWEPPFLLAGIYANAPRSPFWQGRFRTGSYALHHPHFRNQFVEKHDLTATGKRSPDLLASFLGRNCHPIRQRFFEMSWPPEIWIENTSDYDAFTHHRTGGLDRQQHYYEICLRSKFILCARGVGPNSIRLFETLRLGIAPVIISDAWVPCEGPRWEDFALFVAEKDVENLASILAEAEPTYKERGRLARKAYDEYFAPSTYFNYLVSAAVSARSARIIPERCFIFSWPIRRLFRQLIRRTISPLALAGVGCFEVALWLLGF